MDFESLVSVMNVKLLSQDHRLREILPPRLDDLMYRIDSRDGESRYRITVGPVHRAQVPPLLEVNAKDHINAEDAHEQLRSMQDSYPDVGIFFDVDFFRSGEIPAAEASEFVEHGKDAVHQLVSNLGEYILSTDVEA